MKNSTLVVNLFGGPGSGKSTTAAGIFFDLKSLGIDCEIANEAAKELVWEKSEFTFKDQIYLFALQYHRIFRLIDQVNVIITDCPILLTPIYDVEKRSTLEQLVVDEHNKMWTYNVFLNRKKKYNPNGRLSGHDEAKVKELDKDILGVLYKYKIHFDILDGDKAGKDAIVTTILEKINHI